MEVNNNKYIPKKERQKATVILNDKPTTGYIFLGIAILVFAFFLSTSFVGIIVALFGIYLIYLYVDFKINPNNPNYITEDKLRHWQQLVSSDKKSTNELKKITLPILLELKEHTINYYEQFCNSTTTTDIEKYSELLLNTQQELVNFSEFIVIKGDDPQKDFEKYYKLVVDKLPTAHILRHIPQPQIADNNQQRHFIDNSTKIKNSNWLLWLLFILLPPIGIIFMWINQKTFTAQKNFTNQIKVILTVVFSFWFIIVLNASGIFINTNTPKSTELSKKYNFYEESVNNIRTKCNVTPEQADEIFLVLVDNCGVSNLVNRVSKNNDGTFSMYSSGTHYTVDLKDNIVSTVSIEHFFSSEQVYPKIENAQANNNQLESTSTKATQKQTETESQTQEPTTEEITTKEVTTEPETTINEDINENDSNNNAEGNENYNEEPEPYVTATTSANVFTYVLNTSTKKFHVPGCSEVKKMKQKNYSEYTGTADEVISMGYAACKKCHPR